MNLPDVFLKEYKKKNYTMNRLNILIILGFLLLHMIGAPPVDPKKKQEQEKEKDENELDDIGLEYGRYLQQVVQALEEDKDFAKKLENISTDDIKSGNVAKELEFVKHNVRTKLDELKRIELERLRKLSREEMERSELGLYRNEEGHLAPPSIDGRRWRTISTAGGGDNDPSLGIDRKNVKMSHHLDLSNRHTFEVEDLRKLMKAASKDLEEIDRKRREEFKQYEMEKEHQYRESLKNLTEEEKTEAIKKHEEMINKHKDHPKIHHPGSKQQLEQVWEEQDHMQGNEFDPRVFFAMHDVNGDGYLDEQEVEAILNLEVKKMYDPRNGEDDPVEMMEEYNRMREHVYKETDKDKDGLISKQEFIDMTKQADFEQDDGWKGIDEQQIYTEEEMREYEKRRQKQLQQMRDMHYYQTVQGGGVPPMPQHGVPPMPQYQGAPIPQGGYHQQPHPQQGGYQQAHPQQVGYQQQGHQQSPHLQQQGVYQQAHPQQGGYQQQGHQQPPHLQHQGQQQPHLQQQGQQQPHLQHQGQQQPHLQQQGHQQPSHPQQGGYQQPHQQQFGQPNVQFQGSPQQYPQYQAAQNVPQHGGQVPLENAHGLPPHLPGVMDDHPHQQGGQASRSSSDTISQSQQSVDQKSQVHSNQPDNRIEGGHQKPAN